MIQHIGQLASRGNEIVSRLRGTMTLAAYHNRRHEIPAALIEVEQNIQTLLDEVRAFRTSLEGKGDHGTDLQT